MKKADIVMLSALRNDGRLQLTTLARQTGIPVSTLHERLRQKVEAKVFKPTLLLDFAKLGFGATAFVKLAVDVPEKDRLLSYLKACPQVNTLFRINSGWNALAECVFRDMHEAENFVESIEGKFKIRKKDVCYVLDELRRESFLADEMVATTLLTQGKA